MLVYLIASIIAASISFASVPPSSEVILTFHDLRVRVQALSATLLRVEQESSIGFIDNNTNLVANRDALKGITLSTDDVNKTAAKLSTKYYSISLSSTFPQSLDCNEKYTYTATDVTGAVRSKSYPNGAQNQTQASCCHLCDTADAKDCIAYVWANGNGNCWPLAGFSGLAPNKNGRTVGCQVPPPTPLLLMVTSPDGTLLWKGNVPSSASIRPSIPTPADIYYNSDLAWAVRDGPRFIPPAWGATPPPANASLGPLTNTSGFDTRAYDGGDVYIFLIPGAGSASTAALNGYNSFRSEFFLLTGEVPLLPDWAWGLWFTWYHKYNETEKKQEIKHFQSDNIPLDVASLDMDWRNLSVDYKYVVNTDFFPNMTEFFQWVHTNKLRIFFNDHPEPFGSEKKTPSPQMSPAEIKFRYDGLTSILDMGLDFWWFDCHWKFSIPGLTLGTDSIDYKAWGQHVYWDVMKRYYKEKRPSRTRTMMLGCSGSPHPSNHRTPVWWTGDNQYTALMQAVKDEIMGGLNFKPYVHPDCTGHHGADEQGTTKYPPEVYARWVQFCSMGTIYRIHSSHNSKGRQPWLMGTHVEDIMRNFTNMRYKLIPTLVAAGQKTTATGMPLVRRLDLEWPAEKDATRTDQYLLADDLLVAPIDPFVDVKDPVHGPYNRKRNLYLPPGAWIDAFTGERHEGNTTITVQPTLETMPLYHRAGGMVITLANYNNPLNTVDLDWSQCVLDVFPLSSTLRLNSQNHPLRIVRSLFDPTSQSQRVNITKNESYGLLSIHFSEIHLKSAPLTWTIRLHLPQGINENNVSIQLNGQSVNESIIMLYPEKTNFSMPFSGPGKPALPKEGVVIEMRLEKLLESTDCVFIFT